MKKYRSTIPPSARAEVEALPQEQISALFKLTDDARKLNRALPVLREGVQQLERSKEPNAKEVAAIGRACCEYVEMMLLGFMHQLDGFDDREFFEEAQKPELTAPRLYVQLEDVARERLEFYRRVDVLRAAYVKASEAAQAAEREGGDAGTQERLAVALFQHGTAAQKEGGDV